MSANQKIIWQIKLSIHSFGIQRFIAAGAGKNAKESRREEGGRRLSPPVEPEATMVSRRLVLIQDGGV